MRQLRLVLFLLVVSAAFAALGWFARGRADASKPHQENFVKANITDGQSQRSSEVERCEDLIQAAIAAKQDSNEQGRLLVQLFHHGTQVPCPQDLFFAPVGKGEPSGIEDLDGLKGSEISKLDATRYVFIGGMDGVWYVTLLGVSSYPFGQPHFVRLAQCDITSDMDVPLEFPGPSKWGVPQYDQETGGLK